jgi:catechol 2,3-dioxygenase-like lactoylglutathione lyase family enzyme
MFNHVMVGSNDLDRSERFYTALLGVMGVGAPSRNDNDTGQTRLFYRHEGVSFCVTQPINGEPATAANGGTIGFKCTSVEQVKTFHDTAVAHGGMSVETPPNMEGSSPVRLAYVRDPDGNKLCAIYRP